jgi:membrane protease YdiL (CAAX protease family)
MASAEVIEGRGNKAIILHFIFWVIFLAVYAFFWFSFGSNKIADIYYYPLPLSVLVVYLTIFKMWHLIKNAFVLKADEKKTKTLFIALFGIVFICAVFKIGLVFDIIISPKVGLIQSLSEEIIFRAFLLGLLLRYTPKLKIKSWHFYFISVMITSIIFSFLHIGDVSAKTLLGRSFFGAIYGFSFVSTNRKIYVPWVLHWTSNILI